MTVWLSRKMPARVRTERARVVPVEDLDDLIGWLSSNPRVDRLIIDLDNTLSPYGARNESVLRDLEGLRSQLEGRATGVNRVLVLSNGRRQLRVNTQDSLHYQPRARKPFTRISSGPDIGRTVVCGDQYLTDGLLAWRLHCIFFHLVLDEGKEPLWPRTMRRLGGVVCRLFFQPPTPLNSGTARPHD